MGKSGLSGGGGCGPYFPESCGNGVRARWAPIFFVVRQGRCLQTRHSHITGCNSALADAFLLYEFDMIYNVLIMVGGRGVISRYSSA